MEGFPWKVKQKTFKDRGLINFTDNKQQIYINDALMLIETVTLSVSYFLCTLDDIQVV